MKIAVLANDTQWEELKSAANIARAASIEEEADAYILLDGFDANALHQLQKPVLLNSVSETLAGINAGHNVVRINGWAGFLKRGLWEAAGNTSAGVQSVFAALQKQYIQVADEPGLVAARSISMVINEAYFALGEKVSTKEEIDIAMKLGTNYPFGPFEWAGKIGVKNIYGLLSVLAKTDKRYLPAPILEKEASA